MRVLIYLPEEKLTPKGGPLAVGYYYHKEMLRRGEQTFDFIHVDKKDEDFHRRGRAITSRLPQWMYKFQRLVRDILARRALLSGKVLAPVMDYSKYDIIHFHEADQFYLERENLKEYKGIVIYQSHSPLPWWQEKCTDISKWFDRLIPNMKEKMEMIDKWCFKRADYLIFPCPEAEEPYVQNWPYYSYIKENYRCKFRYVLTGIAPCIAGKTRAAVLSKYGIPNDDFVISYVGRHNTVKGYDLLKEIAELFFVEHSDVWVISAGLESPFKRLNHPRWKEIGFTNDPHSLINASDVFVLPNRVTYFDIVMIEILSLSKIVVASRTGGNKYFEKMGLRGVLLYDTTEEAVEILNKLKEMPKAEREEMGRSNYSFYKKYLTVESMYDSYLKVLNDIYKKG